MILKIKNILENLKKDGFSIDYQYGDFETLAKKTTEIDCPTFLIDTETFRVNRENLNRVYTLDFHIMSESDVEEDVIEKITKINYHKFLLQKFINGVKKYEENDVVIFEILQDIESSVLFNLRISEKWLCGLRVKIIAEEKILNKC